MDTTDISERPIGPVVSLTGKDAFCCFSGDGPPSALGTTTGGGGGPAHTRSKYCNDDAQRGQSVAAYSRLHLPHVSPLWRDEHSQSPDSVWHSPTVPSHVSAALGFAARHAVAAVPSAALYENGSHRSSPRAYSPFGSHFMFLTRPFVSEHEQHCARVSHAVPVYPSRRHRAWPSMTSQTGVVHTHAPLTHRPCPEHSTSAEFDGHDFSSHAGPR